MMSEAAILTALERGVFTITLNRPKVNALTTEVVSALQAIFKQAERNPEVRCVLLTGQGRVFSAGQDLTEVKQAEDLSYRYHLLRTYNPLIVEIRRLPKPVLAAINGPVSGAALGIALACDLRMAASDARLVVGFAGIGLAPDSAVSLLLPGLIGLGRAAEYTFTNAPISAEQALEWGLVNRLVPPEELAQQAFAWAAQLAQGPVHAMGFAKRDFNKAILGGLEQLLDYEAHIQEIAGRGAEHKEGVSAFLDKRTPDYIKAVS
jgi:2-(1,2-epoxy-1,2-dihydrophenyl)acetyl-CoA isomerase